MFGGVFVLLDPDPQPESAAPIVRAVLLNSTTSSVFAKPLLSRRTRSVPSIRNTPPPSRANAVPVRCAIDETPVVIVSAAVAECDPSSVTELGVMLHRAFAGAPEQVSATVCVDPLRGAIVAVEDALPPVCDVVPLAGEKAIEKSAGAATFTVRLTVEEVLPLKFASPPYTAVTL